MNFLEKIKSKLTTLKSSTKSNIVAENELLRIQSDGFFFKIKYKTEDLEFLKIASKIKHPNIISVSKFVKQNEIETLPFFKFDFNENKIFDEYVLVKIGEILEFLEKNNVYLKILQKEDIFLSKSGFLLVSGIDKMTKDVGDNNKIFRSFVNKNFTEKSGKSLKEIKKVDNFYIKLENDLKIFDILEIEKKKEIVRKLTQEKGINKNLKSEITIKFIAEVVKKGQDENFVYNILVMIKNFKLKTFAQFLPVIISIKNVKIQELFLIDENYFFENGIDLNDDLLVDTVIRMMLENTNDLILKFLEINLNNFNEKNIKKIVKNFKRIRNIKKIKKAVLLHLALIVSIDKNSLLEIIFIFLKKDDPDYLDLIERSYFSYDISVLTSQILPEMCKKTIKIEDEYIFDLIAKILEHVRRNRDKESSYLKGGAKKIINLSSNLVEKLSLKQTKKINSEKEAKKINSEKEAKKINSEKFETLKRFNSETEEESDGWGAPF